MTGTRQSGMTRRALLGAFAATTVTAAPTFANAAGFLRGAGDIRRIRMYSGRTGERLDMIYWIEGQYIKDAFKEINHFMRDWRTDEVINMDLRTVDIMAASHNLLDVNEPYMLLSGYRNVALALQRCGQELPAPQRSGRRSSSRVAFGHAGCQSGYGLWRRRCWSLLGLQLHPYGLRQRSRLGPVRPQPMRDGMI